MAGTDAELRDGSASVATSLVAPGAAVPTRTIVHPLVLLSAVDHFNRAGGKGAAAAASASASGGKRVVGVLLGTTRRQRPTAAARAKALAAAKAKAGTAAGVVGAEAEAAAAAAAAGEEIVVDVTNSFAVPFEEHGDAKDVWFLDHNYVEKMHGMYRKVQASEKIVGWYSTGPMAKVRPSDIDIHTTVFQKYCRHPTFVVIDVRASDSTTEAPTKAYVTREEVKADGTEQPSLQFHHIASEIGALEAEEVGVEHLLRDVKDTTISTLSHRVDGQLGTLKSLVSHIEEMETYLQHVVEGRAPPNHDLIAKIQDVFNLAPNLNVERLAQAFNVQTNDAAMVMFLASLARTTVSLHDLIDNKLALRAAENADDKKAAAAADKASRVAAAAAAAGGGAATAKE